MIFLVLRVKFNFIVLILLCDRTQMKKIEVHYIYILYIYSFLY